jgi:hypothetical protein
MSVQPTDSLAHETAAACCLLQFLDNSSLDPDITLADGSNLLHEIIDRQDVLAGPEHMSALLQALRQRLKPGEFLGELEPTLQLPRDLKFIEHKTQDGLTALFKVREGWD